VLGRGRGSDRRRLSSDGACCSCRSTAARAPPDFHRGHGLYLRALLDGFGRRTAAFGRASRTLAAQRARAWPGHLHRILRRLDAQAAQKISAADEQKLIRAIEVCLITKKPLTELHRSGRAPLQGWRVLKIGLAPDREDLYARIHARTDAMLERGWLAEVRSLLEAGLLANAKPFDFIGYRELRAALQGSSTMDDAIAAIQQSTRRYAKRQLTWFRREPAVHWFAGFGDDTLLQGDALNWLREQGVIPGRGVEATGV